jgi:hypothetical protein
MKTVAFFTSGAVTLLDRTGKDASVLWKIMSWAARCNLFWTGTWAERGLISLKAIYSLRKG